MCSNNKFSKITQRIDSSRIKYLGYKKKNYKSSVQYVNTIDWSKYRPSRGGVIVYTVIDGTLYFGLGVDTDSGDLTDLGGGIRKKDHTAVQGSLREFMEESLCVFGVYNESQVQQNVVVYSYNMMIIFLHLDLDLDLITRLFNERVKTNSQPEISHLIWLTKDEFTTAINTGYVNTSSLGRRKLYERVKKLLKYDQSFYNLL